MREGGKERQGGRNEVIIIGSNIIIALHYLNPLGRMSKTESEFPVDVSALNLLHRCNVMEVTHALSLHLHQMHANLQCWIRCSRCAVRRHSKSTIVLHKSVQQPHPRRRHTRIRVDE